MTLRQVEELALQLNTNDREQLAAKLAASVSHAEVSDIERQWIDEAERRLDALLSGQTPGIPGDQFFDQVERELGWN